jgi:hypothetical protein
MLSGRMLHTHTAEGYIQAIARDVRYYASETSDGLPESRKVI